MEKILSVAIPTYNMEKYLSYCLSSFICKNMDKLEILVVNDGSKDNSIKIAQEFEKKYPQTFVVIDKPNGGHGSTINAALKVATGKYFKVVDSDDLVAQENMDSFIDVLEKTDADLVLSDYLEFYEDTPKTKTIQQKNMLTNETFKITEIANKFKNVMHNETFKTVLIKDVRLQEHCFYVDVEFNNYCLSKCKTVFYTDLLIYKYRLGRAGQSVSIDGFYKHRHHHATVIFNLCNFYETLNCDSVIKQKIGKSILEMITTEYNIFVHFFWKKDKNSVAELIKFDEELKAFSELYEKSSAEKITNMLRKKNFKNMKTLVFMLKINALLKKLKLKK